MGKLEKSVYDVGYGVVGIVMMGSLAALIFSHLQIQELESAAGGLELMFSESAQEEYGLMENIRIVSAVVLMMSVVGLFSMAPTYYNLTDDPEWELKKGSIAGLVASAAGLLFYVYGPDLVVESIGLAMISMGIFTVVGNYVYLELKRDSFDNPDADKYCSSCGTEASKTDSYCSACGASLK